MGALIDVAEAFAPAQEAARAERASSMLRVQQRGFALAGPFDLGLTGLQGTVQEPFRQHSVVYRALEVVGTEIRRLRLEVRKIGAEEYIADHWLTALWNRPDQIRRSGALGAACAIYYKHWGENLLWHRNVMRGGAGRPARPTGLWLLDPRTYTPIVERGILVAWQWAGSGQIGIGSMRIPVEETTFIRAENPYHEIRGLGALQAALIEYTGDYRAALWNRAFLDNSALPPLVFSASDPMATWPETERNDFLASWNSRQGGAGRVGKAAALPPGIQATLLKVTQAEMEFLDGRKFNRETILATLGVPPEVAGFPSGSGLNNQNFSQARKQFVFGTVIPLAEMIASALTVDLLQRYEPGVEACFRTEEMVAEVLAEEFSAKVETAQKLWGMGVPVEQINSRLGLGLDTRNLPWLSEGWLPFSVVNARVALEPPEQTPDDPNAEPPPDAAEDPDGQDDDGSEGDAEAETERAAHTTQARALKPEQVRAAKWRRYERQMASYERKLLGDWRRFLVRYRDAVTARINAASTTGLRAIDRVTRSTDDFLPPESELHRLAVEATQATQRLIVKDSWEKLLAEIDVEAAFDFGDPNVQRLLAERAQAIKGAANTVADKVRGTIGEVIQEGGSPQDMAAAVKDLITKQYRGQAMTVARTESGAGFSRARREAMSANGVLRHEWLSARDGKVRESHVDVDGDVRVIGETFDNGLTEPHMNGAPPEEVVNCRCTSVPVLEA